MPHSELHKIKLKKNFTVLAIIFGACALFFAITVLKIQKAEAAEIVSCGDPLSTTISTESAYDHCDMQSRQLAYREESLALRQQIQERAENHAAPRREAQKIYKEQLEALHNSITPDNISSIGSN
jgi:hypothetical protein